MQKSKLKVMTIVGTRPEIIRLSRVLALLDDTLDHKLVHTGQNYDYELNQIFFEELELRKPDYFLNVETTSLGATIGDIIRKSEEVLLKENPDALLVLGDTNSCLSAYMAKRMKIPIYHMEAGNRCFDYNVPEEINRRIIDQIADFNLVYTEHARRHLLSEGFPHRRIYLTGSPMNEVLHYYLPKIEKSNILASLCIKKGEYFLVSIHREENVDNPINLKIIIAVLNSIAAEYNKAVIVTTHPRTRKRISELKAINIDPRIQLMKPFGLFDYIKLQVSSLCVISDSGTINEESSIMDFAAVTLRNSIERPEGLDSGSIILTGLNEMVVLDAIHLKLKERELNVKREPSVDYKIENTSWRVVQLIIGTAKLSNSWAGVLNNL